MIFKALTAATLAVALAAFPAEEAHADAGDVIGGLIVGGLLGAAIANGNQGGGNRGTTSGGAGIPATQMGRDTQTALNYFGFNAGVVDGQIGNGTRQAIERYQAVMGYPINGREYATYQYDNLMQAYYWALNGGSAQTGLVGQPLLIAYRDAQRGPQQPQVVVVPAPAPAPAPAPQIVATTPAPAPATTTIVPVPSPAPASTTK